jgi:hypothetical protein
MGALSPWFLLHRSVLKKNENNQDEMSLRERRGK